MVELNIPSNVENRITVSLPDPLQVSTPGSVVSAPVTLTFQARVTDGKIKETPSGAPSVSPHSDAFPRSRARLLARDHSLFP